VYGQPAKETFQNLRISANAWDSDMASVSAKYLAYSAQVSGGGATGVIPLHATGKLPDLFPLFRGHTAPVLDNAWSTFDDSLLATSGEDGKVSLTRVDDRVLEAALSGEPDVSDLQPLEGNARMGHGRKAGHVMFHPTAENVLASSSYEVKLWDLNTLEARVEMEAQPDMVAAMSFDYTGANLATTCKDKKIRIYDTRNGGAAHTTVEGHTGVKASRIIHLGDLDKICTTGFSKMSDRQFFIFDTKMMNKPVKQVTVDTSSGTMMPYFLPGNNMLFFAGKGDGNIRYYELEGEEIYPLSEYQSKEPQKGVAWMPIRHLNTTDCEIARAYKVTTSAIEPISFIVPRKSDSFQGDLFPAAASGQAALSADQFFAGETKAPLLINMEDQSQAAYTAPVRKQTAPASSTPASPAHTRTPSRTVSADPPKPALTPVHPAASVADAGGIVPSPTTLASSPAAGGNNASTPASRAASPPPSASPSASNSAQTNGSGDAGQVEQLKKENAKLAAELRERDALVRKLELQVEQYRTNARKARDALAE